MEEESRNTDRNVEVLYSEDGETLFKETVSQILYLIPLTTSSLMDE